MTQRGKARKAAKSTRGKASKRTVARAKRERMGVKKAARKKVQRMKQPGAPVITITEFEETEVREGIPGRDEPDFTGQRKGNTMLRDDRAGGEGRRQAARNVLGEVLEICSITPMTGFYRDGCCNTGREDMGSHTVCALMTAAFLEFSKSRGNDLSTPLLEFGFPGLKPGDRWCLCAPRWQEAFEANQAPRVVLRATHEGALAHCSLADLKRFAVDLA